ncbi:MAG TPA: hypothetical protein PK878_04415 [bacterium]|nr:hypothetical protein [bacterium]HOL95610.1 hypothetical protein [bacterium]HPP01274.1 hypothetical protein [bacterium]
MEANSSQNPNQSAAPNQKATPPAPKPPERVVIRMWPKTPVLYPMAILALICSLVGAMAGSSPKIKQLKEWQAASAQVSPAGVEQPAGEAAPSGAEPRVIDSAEWQNLAQRLTASLKVDYVLGVIFLIVFAFSLFTVCVDLEIRWALITFSITLAAIFLLTLINERFEFLPTVLARLASLTPMANPHFYFAIFVIWVILMVISLAVVRFHYVCIESNEVVVVGGLLERTQRFPTLQMQYLKDIQDVIEYYLPLVNSGRLVLTFRDQKESVVIDNVLNIDRVISQIDQIVSVLQVQNDGR